MRALVAMLVTVALLVPQVSPAAQHDPAERDSWKRVAEAMPLGTRVEVRLRDGRKITGTLMVAEADGLVVKPRTRLPEPPRRIAYADVERLERNEGGGMSVAKAIGAGLAAGAGAMLVIIGFAFAMGD